MLARISMETLKVLQTAQFGSLEEVNVYLTRASSEELKQTLPTQIVDGVPALHFFTRFKYRKDEEETLDQVISTFVNSGYDINKVIDKYYAKKRTASGFTALLAAIEQQNVAMVECLLRHGARTDIRDARGFSPCHWAIIVGSLKCLEKLIEAGASLKSTEQEMNGEWIDVHPLLHTAVDEGRTEMVFYLLSNGLVDCNEKAIYRGILTEGAFTRFPSRYNNQPDSLETIDVSFTALGRAVRMRKISIIEYLLTIKEIKLTGLEELHFCIVEGDTEVACLLQDYLWRTTPRSLYNEELQNDKINNQWALHCLHPKAFIDEIQMEKTMKLIRAYVAAGWDVNSVSSSGFNLKIEFPKTLAFDQVPTPDADSYHFYPFQDYTLLHLACFYHNLEIIKCLLEEGADINRKTGGDAKVLVPLQILLFAEQFNAAIYLIENGADVMAVGQMKMYLSTSKFMKMPDASDERNGYHTVCFTSLDLLLRNQNPRGLPALDVMLKKSPLQGPREFHAAIQGGNPEIVLKLLQHCVEKLDKKDLIWMNTAFMPELNGFKVPSLIWLMCTILHKLNCSSSCMIFDNDAALINLMKLMVRNGYDCNMRYAVENADDKVQSDEHAAAAFSRSDALIFLIIIADYKYGTANVFLKTLLEFDHVQQNVKNYQGMNPVELVLQLYDLRCVTTMSRKKCWKVETNYCCEAVKLLINHGVDVSNMVIDSKFKYHYGYKPIMQLMYCAGAKIHPDFFMTPPVCHAGYFGTRPFAGEIKELEEWTKKFDGKYKLSLTHLSKLTIRRNLKTIASVKMLETELPKEVKAEVLDIVPV